jgi:YqaJ-like viral recombinase domain
MNPLGLSAQAKERRQNYITASDAKHIMEGNWVALYREKKGLSEPENLDDLLRVQMGSFTEPFNLWWYMKQTGRSVAYYSDNIMCIQVWDVLRGGATIEPEFVVSREYPFMGCSLDATSTTSRGHRCVLDAKHVGTFKYDELVERYTPAMTHQAIVVGVDWWALSVFVGNGRWELIEQEVDVFYREDLIEKEREFWSWMERGEEPPDMRPEAPPKPQPRLRTLDASATPVGSEDWQKLVARNNWLSDAFNRASTFAETEGAFKAHQAARAEIGKLLPDDIGSVLLPTKRGMFSAKRNAAGAITMKVEETHDR